MGGEVEEFIDDPVGYTVDAATQVVTMGTVEYKDGFEFDPTKTINAATQVSTGGMVGYGKDGLKTGIQGEQFIKAGNTAVKGLKDVTGATAAEEANAQARSQFEDQAAQARQQRADAQILNQRNQVAASNNAGAARANRGTNRSTRSSSVGDVSDFLGI